LGLKFRPAEHTEGRIDLDLVARGADRGLVKLLIPLL